MGAGVLLEFCQRMPFDPWQPPEAEILDLRAIVRRIGALTVTRTQERNRLHAAGRCAELTAAIAWDIESHLEHLAQSLERLQQQALDLVRGPAGVTSPAERAGCVEVDTRARVASALRNAVPCSAPSSAGSRRPVHS